MIVSYHGNQFDKEFPPVIEYVVHEGVATGDVFVRLQVLQTFLRNVTHINDL
jgi:hypothetical protein